MVAVECVNPSYGLSGLVSGQIYWWNRNKISKIKLVGKPEEYTTVYADPEGKQWVGFVSTSYFREISEAV